MNEQQQTVFEGWARVEVMGHQTHIGFVRTEVYGQAVMFRVDVPQLPEREYTTLRPGYIGAAWTPAGTKVHRSAVEGHSVLIGSGSIYRILPCTEGAAIAAIENLTGGDLRVISLPEQKAVEPSRDGDNEQRLDAEFVEEEDADVEF